MADQKSKPAAPTAAIVPKKDEPKTLVLRADFGDVYCKVQGGQLMAPIKADINVYEKIGHLYNMKGKLSLTATGYRYLNKVAGISIVTPQSVIVDGRPVPNPHIERNSKTRAIESVNIRKMGIGYSPTGNIVVIDKTLFFNVYTYFIQSIQAKMNRVEWKTEGGRRVKTSVKENPDCAVYGTADEKPSLAGKWAFFPTQDPLGLWVNYEDQAIIDCLEEHTQKQRFGDRAATTIVERSILRDHPAIAVGQVNAKMGETGAYATVQVHGWRNDNTPRDISEIMKQAEGGKSSADFEVQAEIIEDVPEEEVKAATEEAAEGEVDARETGAPEDEGGLPFGAETIDKTVKKSGKF